MIDVIKNTKHQIVYDAMLIGREMTVSEIVEKIKRKGDLPMSAKSVATILRSLGALELVTVDEIKGHDVRVWTRLACVDDAPEPETMPEPKAEPIPRVDYFGMVDEAGLARSWRKLARNEGHMKRLPPSQPVGQANKTDGIDKTASEILMHLSKYGPTTVSKISESMGMTPSCVGAHLRNMREKGDVTANTQSTPTRWDIRKVGGRKRSALPKVILAALAGGKAMTVREMVEVSGRHYTTVSYAMRVMQREGALVADDVTIASNGVKVHAKRYSLASEAEG